MTTSAHTPGSALWREAHPDAPSRAEAEEDLALARETPPDPRHDEEWERFKARHPRPSSIGGAPF